VLVGAQVFYFIRKGSDALRLPPAADMSVNMTKGNTEMIADSLFSEYLLPFEIASLLLLVAVVGSVVMAKKRI
jgi:NADH-quinone oxidoreductase subunit J